MTKSLGTFVKMHTDEEFLESLVVREALLVIRCPDVLNEMIEESNAPIRTEERKAFWI